MSYYQIQNYLSEFDRERILDFTIGHQSSFVPTSTATKKQDYRKSQVLYDLADWEPWLKSRIKAAIPLAIGQLGLSPIVPSQIEMQLTAHGNGDYYKWHNDSGSPEAASRILTYVYYFWREPKSFTGGNLEIEQLGTTEVIMPRNNSIVFFPSSLQHQVTPVEISSNLFEDSRFTINGWVRC